MPAKKSEKDELKGKKTSPRKTTVKKKAATKKIAAKKATTKKASVKKTTTKKPATRKKATRKKQPVTQPAISAEERHAMIAVHAYYQAEARGFDAGMDMDNWIQAEREIDAMLGKSR